MSAYFDDYDHIEEGVKRFLVAVVRAHRKELAPLGLAPDQERDVVTRLAWGTARLLDGKKLAQLEDGRPLLSSLGLIAQGSDSAFTLPFVEHEGVLVAGRVVLTEYVHYAVDQVCGPPAPSAGNPSS
ncbi:hypothetical protein ACVNIS_10685 [Sphaerotilaceae bacterium SBD11-9]